MKRAARPPVVIVEWHDSQTVSAKWMDRSDAIHDAGVVYDDVIVSAGLLIQKTKRYIVLALGRSSDPDDVLHSMVIPRSEIRWMKVVK